MSAKYTLASSGTSNDRIPGTGPPIGGMRQLSDGATTVFIYFDGTNYQLAYTTGTHTTVTSIVQLPANTFTQLVIDASDNLYCLFSTSTLVGCKAFTKGAGLTWTAQAVVTTSGTAYQFGFGSLMAATWCNTGGGTNSAGHILATFIDTNGVSTSGHAYITLDAGVALAGTGTFKVSNGFAFTSASATSPADLSNDGIGSTTVLGVFANNVGGGATDTVFHFVVSSTGTLSTNTSLGNINAVFGNRVKIVRYASNAWAVVIGGTATSSTHYGVARFSSTAQLTAITDCGTPTNMPLNGSGYNWDAFADPAGNAKVWIITAAAPSAGTSAFWRLAATVTSGVTWDTVATADDSIAAAATISNIRVIEGRAGAGLFDWQAFSQTAATPTYALLGDNTSFAAAPNASTLLTPGNNFAADASSGLTFTATYNSADAANANAYALRIKLSGAGTYSYFRASDNTLQSTIQWNTVNIAPNGTISATLPNTLVSNGNTYNWSIAAQESLSNLQGPFATDFTVLAQAAPTITVTGPATPQSNSQPTVSWTEGLAGGAVQTAFHVIVESGTYGTTPGVGTVAWDSGTVGNNKLNVAVTNILSNAVTYRAFVQITQTGSQNSLWGFITFTVQYDAPAQPVLTVTPDVTNARVAVNVQGRDNLLSTDDASFEATLGTWVANVNCTITRSGTQSMDGSFSMRLNSTAGGTMSARTAQAASGYAVLAGKQYTAMASFFAAVSARACTVAVFWWQAGGAASSHPSDTSASVNDASTGWTTASITANAPGDAAFASIVVTVAATGAANEVHYVDEVDIGPGSSLLWTRGGMVPAATVTVQRSIDGGVTWTNLRYGTNINEDSAADQVATCYDYDAQPNTTLNYQSWVTYIDGSGNVLTGPVATTASTTLALTDWRIKDPVNSPIGMTIVLHEDKQSTVIEKGTMHQLLGRSRPVKVTDGLLGEDGVLSIVTPSDAVYAALKALILTSNTLLLQSPFGYQWYVQLTDRQWTLTRWSLGQPYRVVQLSYEEVDAV